MDRREFLYFLGLVSGGVALKPMVGLALRKEEPRKNDLEIGFDKQSLLLNNKRKYIFSGSFHYYRHPSPVQWRTRIRKLKQLGFNAIDTYYYWAYHSPSEGVYDFKESRDIELFMQMIEDEGLYLIARPGPYICAEVDGGGFPGWLLAKKHLNFRCRNKGKFVYDAEYIKYVREWYEEVLPRISKFKNLILLQVENEYNFFFTPSGIVAKLQGAIQKGFGDDIFLRLSQTELYHSITVNSQKKSMKDPDYKRHNDYIRELYKIARELGVKVPIFHNDIGNPSERYVDVDIPAIDNYPIGNFVTDWKKGNPFTGIDLFEMGRDALQMNVPLFGAEIQGGWYDLWGGYGYEHIRRHLGPEAMDITLKSCLAQGMSILNIYMAVGGTNWGYLMDPDVYTSYDYGAPLTEAGRISERGYACQRFSEFVFAHEDELLESKPADELGFREDDLFIKVRVNPSGDKFVFIRNLTGKDQKVRIPLGEFECKYPSMEVYMLDKHNKLVDRLSAPKDLKPEPMVVMEKKPKLSDWKFKLYKEPIETDFDDSNWKEIKEETTLDMDSLGFHYGYVWYRGRFKGKLDSIKIDARHCFSVYLNGEHLKSYDNFQNRVGAGDDLAKVVKIEIPDELIKDENIIVILVESLGHNKGFMEDSKNPRGLVMVDSKDIKIKWRAKGGLVPGETGITPRVDFSSEFFSTKYKVSLPHRWEKSEHGIGIYITEFELDLKEPDCPGVGVKITKALQKANIYINGWLIGRYWEKLGPQKEFYLPPTLLNHKGKNQLVVALWRWEEPAELGEVSIVEYP